MGGTSYSTVNRSARAATMNYHTASMNTIFTQQEEQKVHESMDSKKIQSREARDSEVHPNTVPIIIALDVTGSMGHIPHHLVKDGLPTLMSGIIQDGLPDPALLFLGIGDHECDRHPLQIGQFESGDKELDMWLTRTYIESGGGGNGGESYSLAHYFAANHVHTDAWDKRKRKGILVTIGDEPNLTSYPSSAMKEVMGNSDVKTFTDKEMLEKAQERWEVYHIYPQKYYQREDTTNYWKQLLGERFLIAENEAEIVTSIKTIVAIHDKEGKVYKEDLPENTSSNKEEIL